MLGLEGIRVERSDQVGPAWDAAFGAGTPCLLEFLTEANIPPLPPHITRSQAKNYFAAIEKGDPEADAVRRGLDMQGS
jgi:pyruvate dehydrogenase (quinone)